MEMGESANVTIRRKKKNQTNQAKQKGKEKLAFITDIIKESTCFFWKRKEHLKKDCAKYKRWLKKKGNPISFFYYQSNMTDVNHNTWLIDSGFIIHVTNTLQGLENLRKPLGSELSIFLGNKMHSHVEAIGTCKLFLSSGSI